jgi:hypothetical protein
MICKSQTSGREILRHQRNNTRKLEDFRMHNDPVFRGSRSGVMDSDGDEDS